MELNQISQMPAKQNEENREKEVSFMQADSPTEN
jgi:hypothetical protein